jgi:hypothetical protein
MALRQNVGGLHFLHKIPTYSHARAMVQAVLQSLISALLHAVFAAAVSG